MFSFKCFIEKTNIKFYLFLLLTILLVIPSIKAQPLTSICEQYIIDSVCSSWGQWYSGSVWIDMPSAPHNQWPFPIRTFNCPIQVIFKWRQCQNDPNLHQYQILSYVLNLSYKIWIWPRGWIYPCREALDILKGSSDDVSLRNNEVLDNIFKNLVVQLFDQFRSDLPPGSQYALCDNPNSNPVQFISKRGACQGSCRVQRPALYITLDSIPFGISTPPLGVLQDIYNIPSNTLDSVQIAELDSLDLVDLNSYIQTEINSGIIEDDYKLQPITMAKDAIIIITPIDCTPEYCCIYKITLCVDNSGNTLVNEERTGDIPECIGYPDDSSCPEGTFHITYPCKILCGY
ncbi:MAG: hypothetical protein IJK61_04810 [Bacteroidetes bacterium]|nr:hypothetical protein [Bacteroidota bacterium]